MRRLPNWVRGKFSPSVAEGAWTSVLSLSRPALRNKGFDLRLAVQGYARYIAGDAVQFRSVPQPRKAAT